MQHSNLLAQLTNPILPEKIGTSPDGATAVGLLLAQVIGGLFLVGFITAFIFFITGAFHWITSSGDKGNLENARNKIIQALVGLIVLSSAWAVMTLIGDFLGIELTNLPIPSMKE